MNKQFTKVLVPVNFNRNTPLVMQKAIQVANEFNCDVHLLHVQTPVPVIPFLYDSHFSGSYSGNSSNFSEKKLQRLRNMHVRKLINGLQMTTSVELGNWQEMLKKTIIAEHIDLVLVPKRRKRFWGALIQKIDINKLVQQTRCPVLTVTRPFNIHHLQKIVVPVGDTLPVKKLSLAAFLARQNNGQVHLMSSFPENKNGETRARWCVTRAYQLLRDYTQVNIHCTSEPNHPGMNGTLAFANEIKADLIVVNSGRETKPAGWLSRLMKKYIHRESNIPVLTVAPGIDLP